MMVVNVFLDGKLMPLLVKGISRMPSLMVFMDYVSIG